MAAQTNLLGGKPNRGLKIEPLVRANIAFEQPDNFSDYQNIYI